MQLTRFEMKKSFFDRPEIIARIGEKNATALRNSGGYMQKTAQRSMRRVGKKGRPSKPSMPPRWHGATPSLRTILYAMEGPNRAVIGPVRLNQKAYYGDGMRTGAVPTVHEKGGEMGHREKLKPFSAAGARVLFGARGQEYIDARFGMMPEGGYRRIYGNEFVDQRKHPSGHGIWVPAGRRKRDRFEERVRWAKYPARPYMEPAGVKTAKKFPTLFFGSGTIEGAS